MSLRLLFTLFCLAIFWPFLSDLHRSAGKGRFPSSITSPELYTQDIKAERNSQFTEVILIPPHIEENNISKFIFSNELSREFQQQYRERFQTQWQQTEITLQEMFTAYNSRVIQESQRRREFAEFIVKRLTEHHVDKFIQSDPSMKTIYDVKEKLQNVEVKVNNQTKVNMNYSLSGNILELKFETPYFEESKVIYRMNPRSFGPSAPLLTEYRLTKALSSNRKIQSLYEEQIRSWGFFMLHNITPQLNTFYGLNITTQSFRTPILDPITNQPLFRILDPVRIQAGFGWNF